jgi:hypothetical protein
MQGLPTGDVWLAFKNNLTAAGKAQKCVDILDQLQIFERSYAYDRHGASAYTNPQTSTALFAKKGTGGSKKKDSKVTGGGASAESGKASGGDKTIKCFGCGKKGHKKFECRSKHLWKENSSATEAPKEKAASKANIVKVDPEPAATYSESMEFLLCCATSLRSKRGSRQCFCWEMIAHAHIDSNHRVMSHDELFEKLLSVDMYTR